VKKGQTQAVGSAIVQIYSVPSKKIASQIPRLGKNIYED